MELKQDVKISMAINDSVRKDNLNVKEIIRHFIPAWFAVIMGTGSISILFQSFPYGSETQAMKYFALIIFFSNLFLFILFTAMTITRYILFPDVWSTMIRHPVQSLYTGCFPMGAATLINVAVGLIHGDYGFGGQPFLYVIWSFWWVDVAVSVICCWGLIHVMETQQNHALDKITAVWLLPIITIIVASSSGGLLALALQKYSLSHALITVTVSVIMVAIGLSLALMVLTVYLLRLIVYGLPPGATIISVFLPLGPTGQAGYSILLVGQSFKSLLPLHYGSSDVLTSKSTGDTINTMCVCMAFVLWSLASMWMIFALLGVYDVLRQTRFPFQVPFWGLIFPNGVYANLTIALSNTFDAPSLRVFGAIYAVATLILWIGVTIRTGMLVHNRRIFETPSLEDTNTARFSVTLPACTIDAWKEPT